MGLVGVEVGGWVPLIEVEAVVEQELEIVGGLDREWEIDIMVIWIFDDWWIYIKCEIGRVVLGVLDRLLRVFVRCVFPTKEALLRL